MNTNNTRPAVGRPALIESFPLTVVCAWRAVPTCLGTIVPGVLGGRVSHGICPACEAAMLAEVDR